MSLVWLDRVQETTTTTGTGAFAIAGAVTGYRTFAGVGNNNTFYYSAFAVDANGVPTGDWEDGLGTYSTTGPSITRTTVHANSAGTTSPISFAAAGTNLVVGPLNVQVTPDGYAPAGGDVGKVLLVVGGTGWIRGAYTITAAGGGKWTLSGSPAPVGTAGGWWTLAAANLVGAGADYKNAIGVTRDSVAGTDVYAGKLEFTISQRNLPLTLPWLRTMRSTVAKTNRYAWRGFAAGELLYLGATGRFTPDELWNITHKFAAGEHQCAIPLSFDAATGKPKIVVPFKGAWEYLWCSYTDETSANLLVQVPQAAYVEQVYQDADLTLLGLGA